MQTWLPLGIIHPSDLIITQEWRTAIWIIREHFPVAASQAAQAASQAAQVASTGCTSSVTSCKSSIHRLHKQRHMLHKQRNNLRAFLWIEEIAALAKYIVYHLVWLACLQWNTVWWGLLAAESKTLPGCGYCSLRMLQHQMESSCCCSHRVSMFSNKDGTEFPQSPTQVGEFIPSKEHSGYKFLVDLWI